MAGLTTAAPPLPFPAVPDFDRMRRDRLGKVRATMADLGIDALVLLGNSNVTYATGAIWPFADAGLDAEHRAVDRGPQFGVDQILAGLD